jgi:Spy/CpxP family protein refolding chaperone
VRHRFSLALGTFLFAVSAGAPGMAQQVRPATPPRPAQFESSVPPGPGQIDSIVQAVRSDLQGERADIVAKNLQLTATQAAAFWPQFAAYQKEQNVIMDDQLKGIHEYIQSFETLDDTAAIGLISAHFDRDTRMNELRKKWLAEFQRILGTKLAVRVMQIDRRLSMVHQLAFAAQIPLSH